MRTFTCNLCDQHQSCLSVQNFYKCNMCTTLSRACKHTRDTNIKNTYFSLHIYVFVEQKVNCTVRYTSVLSYNTGSFIYHNRWITHIYIYLCIRLLGVLFCTPEHFIYTMAAIIMIGENWAESAWNPQPPAGCCKTSY